MWIEEFIKLYKYETIDAAFALKHLHIPERLFKYRAATSYALQNLKDDTMWMCDPNRMNDPYDSGLFFNPDALAQQAIDADRDMFVENTGIRKFLTDVQIEQVKKADDPVQCIMDLLKAANPTEGDRIEQFQSIIKNALKKHNDELLEKFNVHIKGSLKICSFSERNDSILMWSHYTNQHTGFCIEYNFREINDLRKRLMYPILYSNIFFDATELIKEENNIYFPILASLFKAEEWSYEKEWRLVVSGGIMKDDQNWQMPPAKAVYLGSRISDKDKIEIINIAKDKGIDVFQMRLIPFSFNLEPVPVDVKQFTN